MTIKFEILVSLATFELLKKEKHCTIKDFAKQSKNDYLIVLEINEIDVFLESIFGKLIDKNLKIQN